MREPVYTSANNTIKKKTRKMKTLNIKEDTKRAVEFWFALLLVVAGLVLLFLGFYAVPIGEISASVLTAYGETATFAGSLLGIDYTYRFKRDKLYLEDERERERHRNETVRTEEQYEEEEEENDD